MYYANLTSKELAHLKSIEDPLDALIESIFGDSCRAVWTGDDNEGARTIRLVASDRTPSTIVELSANSVLDASPPILYWFMTQVIVPESERAFQLPLV